MVQQNAWLSFITKVPLRPGLREVRLSVEEDDRGSVFDAAIDPAGADFSVSDLVLGSDRGAVAWRRDDATVGVSPFMAYLVGDPVPHLLRTVRAAGRRHLSHDRGASPLRRYEAGEQPVLYRQRKRSHGDVEPGTHPERRETGAVRTGRHGGRDGDRPARGAPAGDLGRGTPPPLTPAVPGTKLSCMNIRSWDFYFFTSAGAARAASGSGSV